MTASTAVPAPGGPRPSGPRITAPAPSDPTAWGRVDDDGTVYVRTAEGERAVGSWQAGDAAAGLAHFGRRYDDLVVEAALLEARIKSGQGDAKHTIASAAKLKESLAEANVVGDLAALAERLDRITEIAQGRLAEKSAERKAAAARTTESRRTLVEEAEKLSQSKDWKKSGDRYRAIVEEWKLLRGGERGVETELWQRLSSARSTFDQRRKAHFAELETTRGQSKERKEELLKQAEALRESTEWVTTARRFKELMTSWKAAGSAPKDVEQQLWTRFRDAQDAFFTRRAEHLAERDEETKQAVAELVALVEQAEALDPDRDLAGSEARIRDIQDRWEKATAGGKQSGPKAKGAGGGSGGGGPGGAFGPGGTGGGGFTARVPRQVDRLPRELSNPLEDRLRKVEEKIRDLGEARRRAERPEAENPLVASMRAAVAALEAKAAKGDAKAAAELETKREWLAQAEAAARS
jgi:hypothetical protein